MPLQEATGKESLNFNQLCTFESFEEVWSHYGYKSDFKDVIEREFSRTKGTVLLRRASVTAPNVFKVSKSTYANSTQTGEAHCNTGLLYMLLCAYGNTSTYH